MSVLSNITRHIPVVDLSVDAASTGKLGKMFSNPENKITYTQGNDVLNIKPITFQDAMKTAMERKVRGSMTDVKPTKMVDEYIKGHTDGLNRVTVDTDEARELIPAVIGNRNILTENADTTQKSAAAIKNAVMNRLLGEQVDGKLRPRGIKAGGGGSGKGSAIKAVEKNTGQLMFPKNSIISDETFKDADTLYDFLERGDYAKNGGTVDIVGVYNKPTNAFPNVGTRAMEQLLEVGSGRTVPVTAAADTYNGANKTIAEVATNTPDNVNIKAINNYRDSKGNPIKYGMNNEVITDKSAIAKLFGNEPVVSPMDLVGSLNARSAASGAPNGVLPVPHLAPGLIQKGLDNGMVTIINGTPHVILTPEIKRGLGISTLL